jgi:phosphotransferase system IIA component
MTTTMSILGENLVQPLGVIQKAQISDRVFLFGGEGQAVHPAAGCFDAFYDGLKNNTSIMYFDLSIRTESRTEQLVYFGILDLEFENNGVFEQIISACLGVGVKELEVCCQYNFQYTALAALLQDRRAILQRVLIQHSESIMANFDKVRATREIMASLVGNTELKELVLPFYTQEARNDFDLLLCDSSTIEQIRNSNHTIETVKVESYVFPSSSTRTRQRVFAAQQKREQKQGHPKQNYAVLFHWGVRPRPIHHHAYFSAS